MINLKGAIVFGREVRRNIFHSRSLFGFFKPTPEEALNKKDEKAINSIFDKSELVIKEKEKGESELTMEDKKRIFEDAWDTYMYFHKTTRRGHVQFIKHCLKKVNDYGLNKDLEIYKKIFCIFPEEKFIPSTLWQVELKHFPLQQSTALEIIMEMEKNFVIPDEDFAEIVFRRFGMHTSPFVKLSRMIYWLPKVRNMDPWHKPLHNPNDPVEVARIAMVRMNLEKETDVTVHEIVIDELSSWLVSSQSSTQKNILKYYARGYNVDISSGELQENILESPVLYVDGPFYVWLNNERMAYYTLNTELDKDRVNYDADFHSKYEDFETFHFDKWYTIFGMDSECPVQFGGPRGLPSTDTIGESSSLPAHLTPFENVVDNQAVLALCLPKVNSNVPITTMLRSWIGILTRDNPELNKMKIVFRADISKDIIVSADGAA